MNTRFGLPSPPALRLRRFLHERGLRLKPWATQEEILEAFLAHLAHDLHGDDYWDELTQLASDLAEELRQRRPGSALAEAIVLDAKALMQELRLALAKACAERQGFHGLGTMVTGPAMSLLLLVTLVGVGCGGNTGSSDRDGASAAETTGGAGAGGTATLTMGGGGGASAGTASGTMGGAGGASAGTGGQSLIIDLPSGDAAAPNFGDDGPQLASDAPSWGGAGGGGGAGGASGCIPDEMTFREMVEACVTDSGAREAYLAALEASHPDWPSALREYFRCGTCGDVLEHISHCYYSSGQMGSADPPSGYHDIYDFCRPIIVYAGVRFT